MNSSEELLQQVDNLREITLYFNQYLLQIAHMGNPNKGSEGGADLTSPRDVHQAAQDLSREREARDAALAKQVVEAVAREMAKAHTHTTKPYSMREVQL